MIDLKITDDRSDLAWQNGDLVLAVDADAVRQFVWIAYQTWAGDWFLDRSDGVHYPTRILGKATRAMRQAEVRRVGSEIPGLISIESSSFTVDAATRLVDAELRVRTEFDQAPQPMRLEPAPVFASRFDIEDGYYMDGELVPVPDGYWVDGENTGEPDQTLIIYHGVQ